VALIFHEHFVPVLADEAGDGKMEVTVETEEGKIPTELEALGEGTFEVTFMGDGERKHTLNILFNGEHIPCKYLILVHAEKLNFSKQHLCYLVHADLPTVFF
jgi:hypothetical protein